MASLRDRRTHPYCVADELLLRLAESIAAGADDEAGDNGTDR
jgi:hypothetical protein